MRKVLLSLVVMLSVFALFAADEAKTVDAPAADEAKTVADVTTVVVPTIAVLPFEARTRTGEQNNDGKSIAELIGVGLLESGNVDLVERAELEKALTELQLSAIGMVNMASQNKLGKMIGAKILITGSMFRSGEKNYIVAKIIGTETSRVLGCSVSGTGEFSTMTPELSKKIGILIEKSSEKILPKMETGQSTLTSLAETVKGNDRKVYVQATESINVSVPDPAAETELKKLLLGLGFSVVDTRDGADFILVCEAVASQAGSYHKFTSAQARVELSIFDKNQKLLVTGSAKETLAGATYIIAAKDAIAQAALRLSGELFPVIK
ncbi:MAG: CsgG/HfaB family protein [Victivallaceae bacterium]|nr:CsgG/HfaB family protein [Victivallaceae bacterium]